MTNNQNLVKEPRRYQQITSWDELKAAAGIAALTGEACAYSQRLLCDVNADGLALLEDFFGAPGLTLAPPWNSSVNDKPSVGSIMLARALLVPLAEFLLASQGALALLFAHGKLVGGIFDTELLASYAQSGSETFDLRRLHRPNPASSVGSRNIHQATSRTI